MKSYGKLLKNVKTLAVVCHQWGDTGKGKFVDLFAGWADIIARGTGGANAGHTIMLNGRQYIFHLVPSGILRDREGKENIIGSGVAFDPRVVLQELEILKREKKSFNNLRISHNAKLVLPQHIVVDRVKESESGKGKIGTTGRGIGPLYIDHYSRVGLIVNDMLNPDIFAEKLKRNLKDKVRYLKNFDPELVKSVMHHELLGGGCFYDPLLIFDTDAIIEKYMSYGKLFKDFIRNTDLYLRESVGQKKILLEGAQGLLLSIDKGSYPYVTSSESSFQGLARGVGLYDSNIDLTLGIVKAFYMTRVGAGAFPTEVGGRSSAEWCSRDDVTKNSEKCQVSRASVNSQEEFGQNVGIRIAGGEYGATTGRPRRVGWLDLPLLRYAVRDSGPNVIFTKLDVLNQCNRIKICSHYLYQGPRIVIGNMELKKGSKIHIAVPNDEILRHCQPRYKTFDGWHSDLGQVRSFSDLPKKFLSALNYIIQATGIKPWILSVGPERNQTIFL
jgi:adenylosuccinate synthase